VIVLLLFLLQDPVIEIEARAAIVGPKFRLRDGEPSLKGESVFSDELDAEGDVFSPGGEVAVRWGDERFAFEYWSLTAEGDGALDEPKPWGGAVVPAGTVSDTEVFFQRVELGWTHRFDLYRPWKGVVDGDPEWGPWLWLNAGLSVEWMVVDADLGFGSTRLGGVFPTPQASLGFRPWSPDWLEASAGIGGFFVPFKSGDTSCLDPIEYTIELKARAEGFSFSLGYNLYHVHLEEQANHVDEDVVHLRLRGLFFTLGVRF